MIPQRHLIHLKTIEKHSNSEHLKILHIDLCQDLWPPRKLETLVSRNIYKKQYQINSMLRYNSSDALKCIKNKNTIKQRRKLETVQKLRINFHETCIRIICHLWFYHVHRNQNTAVSKQIKILKLRPIQVFSNEFARNIYKNLITLRNCYVWPLQGIDII